MNSATDMTGTLIVVLVLNGFLFNCVSAADEKSFASPQPLRLSFTDINGSVHTPFADDSTLATILVFVSTDCPVANAFHPTLAQIQKEYKEAGLRFFVVHSSPRVTKQKITRHIKSYNISIPVVLDADQMIARSVHAKVTPEAIVIDRDGHVRYRGLINNLYAGYGKKRRAATEHYLTDALDALIDGTAVRHEVTQPVGCFIHYQHPDGQ